MTAKQVLQKFNALVPFPYSVPKIRKAGYSPSIFLHDLIEELRLCEDKDTELVRKIIKTHDKLH